MSYKSAIFGYIRLKFSIVLHPDVFYNIYSVFLTNKKTDFLIYFFFNLLNRFLLFLILKIRDSSSVGLSILSFRAKKLVET